MTKGSYEEGAIFFRIFNFGKIEQSDEDYIVKLYFSQHEEAICQHILQCFKKIGEDPILKYRNHFVEEIFSYKFFNHFMNKYQIEKNIDDLESYFLENMSSDFKSGYLRLLLDSNGDVLFDGSKNRYYLKIVSTNFKRLKTAQEYFKNFGILFTSPEECFYNENKKYHEILTDNNDDMKYLQKNLNGFINLTKKDRFENLLIVNGVQI